MTTHELAPVEVRRGRLRNGDYVHPGLPVIPMEGVEAEKSGWLYDFGVNAAGLCRRTCRGIEGYIYKGWKSCDPRIFRWKDAGDALLYPKDQDGTSSSGV